MKAKGNQCIELISANLVLESLRLVGRRSSSSLSLLTPRAPASPPVKAARISSCIHMVAISCQLRLLKPQAKPPSPGILFCLGLGTRRHISLASLLSLPFPPTPKCMYPQNLPTHQSKIHAATHPSEGRKQNPTQALQTSRVRPPAPASPPRPQPSLPPSSHRKA